MGGDGVGRAATVRTAVGLVGVLVGAWVVVAVLAFVFQRQLIYLPDRADPGPPPDGVEEVTLHTADGLALTVWTVAAEGDPVATVLVTPGNAGTRALRLPLATGLAERGYDVLLLEYRGYGGNPGRPSEDGLRRDAVAAADHLAARGVDEVVLLGESIGTGVAAALAHELAGRDGTDAGVRPVLVALRSPFPQLADVAAGHYPFLPVRALLRERFPVVDHLVAVEAPVLVIAGGADHIVPTALSRRVAEELGATYVEVPGADHNDLALLDGDLYLDAVDELARQVVGTP
jgi:uncharacterized protein